MTTTCDDQAEGRIRPTCNMCGGHSPQTQTNFTLIGATHQWRMELQPDAQGRREPVWYCPNCWKRHKQARHVEAVKIPSVR